MRPLASHSVPAHQEKKRTVNGEGRSEGAELKARPTNIRSLGNVD